MNGPATEIERGRSNRGAWFLLAVGIAAIAWALAGCVSAARYQREAQLLHEAREHYRGCMDLVKKYERAVEEHNMEQAILNAEVTVPMDPMPPAEVIDAPAHPRWHLKISHPESEFGGVDYGTAGH